MKHNQEIEQQDSHLLQQESDSSLNALMQDLNTLYAKPEAPNWLTWATTKARASEEKFAQKPLPRRLHPIGKLSLSLGMSMWLIVIIVSITLAAVIIPPHVQDMLGLTYGAQSLVKTKQFTPLNLTQTLDGTRFTVQAAYADANEIIIGQTMTSPKGQNNSNTHKEVPSKETLKTDQGQVIPAIFGTSDNESAGTITNAMLYDASGITGNPKQLSLRLELSDGSNTVVFHFSIPFHPGLVITPHQRVTTDGVTATLEKIVITPSETRIVVQGLPGDVMPTNPAKVPGMLAAQLKVPTVANPYDYTIAHPGNNQTVIFDYSSSLVNKSGNWTLTLSSGSSGYKTTPPNVKVRTWVFNFSVH